MLIHTMHPLMLQRLRHASRDLGLSSRVAEPFAAAHDDIWGYWEELDANGQFACITDELARAAADGQSFKWQVAPRAIPPLSLLTAGGTACDPTLPTTGPLLVLV